MGRSKRKLDIKTDLAVFKAVKKQFVGIKKNSSFQVALAQKKYRPRFLARSCFDQRRLAILTKPLEER